jgi:phosphoglucosamine mutase
VRFGTDGVRGVAGTELTIEFAHRLGRAAARVLAPPDQVGAAGRRVVIGGDTRESTADLDAALAAGFRAEGVEVMSLGVAPTPMVAFEAQRRDALGAVVSASHNPYHDNGIKLFGPGGRKLSDDVETLIEAELERVASASPASEPTPSAQAPTTAPDRTSYVNHVLSALGGRRLDGLRVVLDAANGAGSVVGPEVLRATGAELVVVCDRPDGRNINDGCGATVPSNVARAVVEHGADVGVALDGDADRLIAVDHTGAVVDGDHIIAIVAADLHQRGELRHDTVVVTVMTNLGFRLAMREAGITVVETAVGDRYVLEALADGGYSLGGEQSGHVIFADRATTGDGVLTAVSLLDVVGRSGRSLADLAAEAMTSLPQVLVNVEVSRGSPDVAALLADDIARVESALGERGRILVRPSGTEPLVRVMVEAPTLEEARTAADELAAAAHARLG